uniref:Uncharacterized protein n=1 Tax=Glossina pallidipes TaxID=7398 RepID=A0A1B0AB69_GLOPL
MKYLMVYIYLGVDIPIIPYSSGQNNGQNWKGSKRGGRQTELFGLNRGGGSSPGRASASYVDISSSNGASVVLAKIDRANKSEGNVPSIRQRIVADVSPTLIVLVASLQPREFTYRMMWVHRLVHCLNEWKHGRYDCNGFADLVCTSYNSTIVYCTPSTLQRISTDTLHRADNKQISIVKRTKI